MLHRIEELIESGQNFAFETTLSTRSYKEKVENARMKGYNVTILYFGLQNVELAKERVRIRVMEGGHNIAEEVIERRYNRGAVNFFEIFLPIVDDAMIFDIPMVVQY